MCDPFNHGLIIKKLHRLREFNQKALLKPYIDMNTELRRKITPTKMTSLSLWKTMENVRCKETSRH